MAEGLLNGLRPLHHPQPQGAPNEHERPPGFFCQARDPVPPSGPPHAAAGAHRGPRALESNARKRCADRGLHGGDDPAPPKPGPVWSYTQSPDGFSWKAAARMEGWAAAWRPQTWPEKAWPAAQVYDPAYVNPTSWAIKVQGCVNKADFDLNMANKDALSTYSWTFNGATQTGKRCVRDLTFDAQGIFPVKMEVSDATGKKLLSKTRDVRVRDLLIVVLGDSMSSGEGSPDLAITAGKKARWVDPQCHRSRWAPGALAAKAIEDMDPTTSVTFLSFACSGATIDKDWPLTGKHFDAYEKADGSKMKGTGVLGWYLGIESPSSSGMSWDMPKYQAEGGKGVPSQIQQLKFALAGRKIDSVIMSAGLNDAGFSRMIATCVLFKECPSEVIGYNSKEMPLSKRFANDAAAVAASYERLGKELNPLTKRTLVFEYPEPAHGRRRQDVRVRVRGRPVPPRYYPVRDPTGSRPAPRLRSTERFALASSAPTSSTSAACGTPSRGTATAPVGQSAGSVAPRSRSSSRARAPQPRPRAPPTRTRPATPRSASSS